MDKSLLSKDIDSYEKVSDSKAGLKDVYIIESAGKKYVFSQDNGTGWNWLSEEYIEPLVIEWLQSIKPEISPNIVEYDMENKLMLTQYVGDKDLSDINHTTENMRQFGNKVGEIHTIGDFDGFGGLKLSDESVLETQHSDWSETLTLLVEHTDSLPNTSDDKSTKQVIKNQISQLCTDSISPCFSHGDLGPANVRVGESNNIDSIIDWQNAWVSDGLTEFLYR